MKDYEEFNSNQIAEAEKVDEFINIQELVSKYVYHWPVFLLSVLLCLTTAFVYLRYSQPVYSVNSTLLIKDDKKGAMPSGGDLLNELNLFATSKIVENEIEILKSKALMRKVVDRLSLSITYNAIGRVKNSDLYSSKPVHIQIVQMDSSLYGKILEVSFPNYDTYLLEDKESGKTVKGTLGQLQRNIFGVYKISRSKNFKKYRQSSLAITIDDPTAVVDRCLSQLSVSLASKQSTVLVIGLESTVPQRGQDILNTLVQVYNEAALEDKNRTTQSTIQFIDERLKLITGELTDVEQNVETFKSSRGLTDISSDADVFLGNVKANDLKLNEINLQISVIKNLQNYLNSKSAYEKLPTTLGINDPVILGQITQLSELQLQRDQLLTTTTDMNPTVAPLTKQIETTRAGIKTSLDNILKTLQVSKADLENNNSQFQGSIKKIPGQERQLISIKRQQTIKESLYLYLLQKKEEAALSYASAVADSRTVDPAFYSKVPVKPKNLIIYLSGLLIGLILPLGYIYLKDLLNFRVEGSSDISKLTSTPILGEILYNEEASPIVVEPNSRKAIAEQFRAIRTNMQFLHGKPTPGRGKVTLFTSSMSGEGKTFVASNISAALAIGGKRTVLLELDLRKPKVSKYLNLDNKSGLSNFLIGKADISNIIQASNVHENLFIIGSGPIPPNPSELLIQTEIEVLITYLKDNFDEIIIDTPPIGLVTDAQILSRLTDASIYLVRQDVTFKRQLKLIDSIYKSRKFPNLNIILNGIKGGGSYGYGYGYGYYSDDQTEKTFNLKLMIKNFIKRF